MTDMAIQIGAVTRKFGAKTVLDELTLSVPAGQTFAFLGRNGAGKTTTIRMLLGLLSPEKGVISVLGLNPQRDALEIRRRVGYLAEDQVMFGWMKVGEIIEFMAPFYPTWDTDLAKKLLQRFELPPETKVKHLSKGQNVRLGLLLAMAHQPKLVILDDPTLGLDPIMRKEFLRDVVEHLQGRGVTVFFSSHLLYEIEPVADMVAILDKGKIVRQSGTEQLREDVKQLIMTSEEFGKIGGVTGKLDVKASGNRVSLVIENAPKTIPELMRKGLQAQVIDINLDEIFEAYVIGSGRKSGKEVFENVA